MNKQETGRQAETEAQPADLVTDDGAPAQSAAGLCSRELDGRTARQGLVHSQDRHNGDWRGPYSSVASVSLMIARELAKELVKCDSLAAHD